MFNGDFAISDLFHPRAAQFQILLEHLNARISRLSIFVGASLKTETDIQKIMKRENPIFNMHKTAPFAVAQNSANHRLAHSWEELRGLLMLRDDIVARMLIEFGSAVTEQIAIQADEQLKRFGFKPWVYLGKWGFIQL